MCPEGGTVIDGGAHIGLFTVIMARAVGPAGQVLAFEPTPGTRTVLSRTLELNDVDNVTVQSSANSSTSGTATFHATGDAGSNANSLGRVSRAVLELSVNTCALDDLALGRVSCIKLDIEGGELDALLGASELLRHCHGGPSGAAAAVWTVGQAAVGGVGRAWRRCEAERPRAQRAQFTRETEPFEVKITLDGQS